MARITVGKNSSKKEMILRQAVILFKTRGFSKASMRHLAEAMGVEAPSLYNHIGSKDELLQDICFKIAAEYTGQLNEVEALDETVSYKVEQVIRFHIRKMLHSYDEVFVANHEWRHLPEPYHTDFLQQRRCYEQRLVALIELGIAAQQFKPINPYVAVLTLLSAVRGLEFWNRHKKNITAAEIEAGMVQQLLNGLIQ